MYMYVHHTGNTSLLGRYVGRRHHGPGGRGLFHKYSLYSDEINNTEGIRVYYKFTIHAYVVVF